MNSRTKIQRFIAGSLFITINVLFYFKYLYRVSLVTGLVGVGGYLIFLYFVYCLYRKRKLIFPNLFWIGVLGLLTISSGFLLHIITKESLHVDRWEMIQLFWDAASNGIYPYGVCSLSGNYPGPMPFYFILTYPFYLIGEIGWMTVVGLWIVVGCSYKKLDGNDLGWVMILLLSSLAIYWEIFARSTIFINSLLFAIYFCKLKDLSQRSALAFYGWAVLGGILFSTRTVFALPLIIWGIYICLRKEIKIIRFIKWGICFICSFIITFLPFYCMDPHTFMQLNPFITQGDILLPFSYIFFFLVLAFVFPFFCKKYSDIWFYSGLLLFSTITGHVVYALFDSGIDAYLRAGADISYYIFCFPFLLKTIVNRDEE